jgi:hypothetical protein
MAFRATGYAEVTGNPQDVLFNVARKRRESRTEQSHSCAVAEPLSISHIQWLGINDISSPKFEMGDP